MDFDFSVASQVGLMPAAPASPHTAATSTQRVAIGPDDTMPWYSPRSPLVWLVGIAAVTVGAASIAGSVRLGPAKISGKVGS